MNNGVHFITTTASFFCLFDFFSSFWRHQQEPFYLLTYFNIYRVQPCLTWGSNSYTAGPLPGRFTPSRVHCPNHPLTCSHPLHELDFGVQVCADPGPERENVLKSWAPYLFNNDILFIETMILSWYKSLWVILSYQQEATTLTENTQENNATQSAKVTGVKESLSSMQHVWLMKERCGDMLLGLTSLPHQSGEMGKGIKLS